MRRGTYEADRRALVLRYSRDLSEVERANARAWFAFAVRYGEMELAAYWQARLSLLKEME
jgi:hypothetical protein